MNEALQSPNQHRLCWLCEEGEATTREHRVLNSILKRTYPNRSSSNKCSEPLLGYTNRKQRKFARVIQGPSSNSLKFNKSLCGPCNHHRTKLPDNIFLIFWEFLVAELSVKKQVTELEIKDLEETEAALFHDNLLRYLIKLFGCTAIERSGGNFQVPQIFKNFILQGERPRNLFLSVCYNSDFDRLGNPWHIFVLPKILESQIETIDGERPFLWFIQLGPVRLYLEFACRGFSDAPEWGRGSCEISIPKRSFTEVNCLEKVWETAYSPDSVLEMVSTFPDTEGVLVDSNGEFIL